MDKKLLLSVFFLAGLGLTEVRAQEALSATGGTASGSGGTVNYSIGQLMFSSIGGASGTVMHGVQQVYEVSVVTGLDKDKDLLLEYKVYPNPTINILHLTTGKSNYKNLSYQLFDVNGKLLETRKVTNDLTSILMRHLSPATYLLRILENETTIKIFKIVKR